MQPAIGSGVHHALCLVPCCSAAWHRGCEGGMCTPLIWTLPAACGIRTWWFCPVAMNHHNSSLLLVDGKQIRDKQVTLYKGGGVQVVLKIYALSCSMIP